MHAPFTSVPPTPMRATGTIRRAFTDGDSGFREGRRRPTPGRAYRGTSAGTHTLEPESVVPATGPSAKAGRLSVLMVSADANRRGCCERIQND